MEERNEMEESRRRCWHAKQKERIIYHPVPGRRCQLAKKRPSLREVVEEYGLKVLLSRVKLLEIEL